MNQNTIRYGHFSGLSIMLIVERPLVASISQYRINSPKKCSKTPTNSHFKQTASNVPIPYHLRIFSVRFSKKRKTAQKLQKNLHFYTNSLYLNVFEYYNCNINIFTESMSLFLIHFLLIIFRSSLTHSMPISAPKH